MLSFHDSSNPLPIKDLRRRRIKERPHIEHTAKKIHVNREKREGLLSAKRRSPFIHEKGRSGGLQA